LLERGHLGISTGIDQPGVKIESILIRRGALFFRFSRFQSSSVDDADFNQQTERDIAGSAEINLD